MASLDGPKNPTMDDVKRAAEEYNKIGEQAAKAGFSKAFTTKTSSFGVDGKRTYDLLFGLLDPKLVKFQFQVSTISEGFDAAEYFTKYPGRFISMHVQGWPKEKEDRAGRPGRPGLEEDFLGREDRRHQELFRRDGSRHDEGQRALPSQTGGLMSVGIRNTQSNWQGRGLFSFSIRDASRTLRIIRIPLVVEIFEAFG